MNKKFKLFTHLFPVNGYYRSIIYDLHYEDFSFQNRDLSEKLISICNSKSFLSSENIDDEYIVHLHKYGYIFEIKEGEQVLYSDMSLYWDYPSEITNLMIDISQILELNDTKICNLINYIEKIGTKHILLISEKIVNHLYIDSFMSQISNSIIQSVEIVVRIDEDKYSLFEKMIKNNKRIKYILFHSSKQECIKQVSDGNEHGFYAETTNKFSQINYQQSMVTQDSFTVNIPLFTESQAYHTYFNRKLYIGENGEIKNAPECEETFGNISEINNVDELKQIIATPKFQKYWFVHKELCDVCKECEFRHMCVDNRLPYQRKDGSWYHKTECNYNPYICKWKDEEGYHTLEECGVLSNENGFSINHEKIAAINKILWEEEETENA